MKLETVTHCPVCHGKELINFLQAKDYTTSGESFTIHQCKTCELGITSPRPDQQNISKYYQSEKYISHTGGGKNISDILYRVARNFMLAWKQKLAERYEAPGKILDYGCGTGEFLTFMKRHRWQITGIEPSSHARTKAEINTSSKIYETITTIPDEQFDLITLWHVAEHLHDLEQTIISLKKKMKLGGTLFVAVPNYQSPDSIAYQSEWAGYDVPRHVWHFSKKSMTLLLEKNGMKLEAIRPMKLDAFYISYLSECYRHSKRSSIINLIQGIFHGMLSNLQASKNVNHSSLLYIAKA